MFDIIGQINRYTLRYDYDIQSFKIRYSIILLKEFIRKYFAARIAGKSNWDNQIQLILLSKLL